MDRDCFSIMMSYCENVYGYCNGIIVFRGEINFLNCAYALKKNVTICCDIRGYILSIAKSTIIIFKSVLMESDDTVKVIANFS